MRLVTFRKGKANHIGAILGNSVADIVAASRAVGGPSLPADMIALLEMGAKGMRAAKAAARFAARNPKRGLLVPLSLVRLEAPVPCPPKLLALAGNYSSHLREEGRNARAKREQTPRVFMKPPSTTVNRPGGEIVITRHSHWVDWEVELGIVIGTRARYVTKKAALGHVAGYCMVNDVSEREFQIERGPTWDKGKGFDTFGPVGPWLVTPDEVGNPQKLAMWLDVNGEKRQRGSTKTMIFDCATLISYVSMLFTLNPGDIITTGTPPGVGMGMKPKQQFLRHGDVVTMGIEKLGEARQKVVRFKA